MDRSSDSDWRDTLSTIVSYGAPDAYLISADRAAVERQLASGLYSEGSRIAVVDGRACQSARAVFKEWSRQLGFPRYFRTNWNSFYECIEERDWLDERLVVVVLSAESLGSMEDDDLHVFGEILSSAIAATAAAAHDDANRNWVTPPPPLVVVFQCAPAHSAATAALLREAGIHFARPGDA